LSHISVGQKEHFFSSNLGGPYPTVGEHYTSSWVTGDIVPLASTINPDSNAEHDPPLHDRPMIELVGQG